MLEWAIKMFAPCVTCTGFENCEKNGKAASCTLHGFKPNAWQFNEKLFYELGGQ
jgi:hypothetical protein